MIHIPVLLNEVIDASKPHAGMKFLDGTFGAGGHSKKMCEMLSGNIEIVAIDTDTVSLEKSVEIFPSEYKKCLKIFSGNYRNFDVALDKYGIENIDTALLDLGFSSDQMDESGRGFTFQKDQPLLMTLKDPLSENDLTAKEIVNTWDAENIHDIIKYYGEERYAKKITDAIVTAREIKPIETTFELSHIIEKAVPSSYRKQKINPSTRTFQALRITVNDELGSLQDFLEKIIDRIESGGRVVIISFHSLEDRIVKKKFREWEENDIGKRITKKPIIASEEERISNPRSRSAKLRVFEKN